MATTPAAAEMSDEDEYYHTADEDEELGHAKKQPIARSDDPRSGAFGDAVHRNQGEDPEARATALQGADDEFTELNEKTEGLRV